MMDLLAGQAMEKLREEVNRPLQDHGPFAPPAPPGARPHHRIDAEKYDRFLDEEMAARRRRRRKFDRQTLVWVATSMLLPVLLFLLNRLVF